MGVWRTKKNGRYESYYPDVGEIVSYNLGGIGVVTVCHGVYYDLVSLNGSTTKAGVWDMRPASEADKAHLRASIDVASVPLDRTFENAMPCGAVGAAERTRAIKARVKRIVTAPWPGPDTDPLSPPLGSRLKRKLFGA